MGQASPRPSTRKHDETFNMGKVNLTLKQRIIFDEFRKSNYLKENFYFTGGTALSAVYLQHRESEDLDFFSGEKFEGFLQ